MVCSSREHENCGEQDENEHDGWMNEEEPPRYLERFEGVRAVA
jgi:hypothetical protein